MAAYGFTRSQLISAIVTALTGATDAGARVYHARTSSLSPQAGDGFPAILVWHGPSDDENILDACATPAEFTKTWQVTIDMRVVVGASTSDDDLDAALDTLEEQVRAVLLGSVAWSSGLDEFEQIASAGVAYDDTRIASDGKTARAALTLTITSGRKYG